MQPPPLTEPQSELSRITGVFVEPQRAFTDIVARPRWYIPVIISSILALTFISLYSQRVGWERVVRQSIEQNPRTAQMTNEQRAQAIQMGVKFGSVIGYVQSAIGPAIGVLLIGGVLMFVANSMLGTQIRYPQMLGITAYSFLTGVVQVILMITVMFLKPPEDFDIQHPLAFNAGAFLNPESTAKWLMAIASSIDLFTFWTIWLLAVGISVAGRKITVGKALNAVVVPWLVWVVLKTCWAAMFG